MPLLDGFVFLVLPLPFCSTNVQRQLSEIVRFVLKVMLVLDATEDNPERAVKNSESSSFHFEAYLPCYLPLMLFFGEAIGFSLSIPKYVNFPAVF